MSGDWAEKIAEQLTSRDLMGAGICLILGAADTGKTTLAAALCKRLVRNRPVGVIDADVGQSHIGPPATVGWAVVERPEVDLSQLRPGGISFVGDITPVGHLLQSTAAITQGVQQLSEVTDLIVIDTPGFISGPAASVLWWTVQRILRPELVLAVQRDKELSDILAGLQNLGSQIELIKASPEIPAKSPQARRSYRQSQFRKYFRDSHLYNINLSKISLQAGWSLRSENMIGRLVALRDGNGIDVALGMIDDRRDDKDMVVIKAPQLDINQICCLVIGDVSIDITGE